MNHLRTLILLLAVTAAGIAAQAQVRFGVKGGYNITQMSLGTDVLTPTNKNGFFLGPTVHIDLPLGISFNASGLYDQRAWKLNDEELCQKTVCLPVNLRLSTELGRMVNLFMETGPQFNFTLGDIDYDLDKTYASIRSMRHKESFCTANVGLGLSIDRRFEIGCTYNIAPGRTGQLENTSGKQVTLTRASAWQITAAVLF